jgi:hypothetical protein
MVRFKFCAGCDAPLVAIRRDAKFCSSPCRQRAYRARKAAGGTSAGDRRPRIDAPAPASEPAGRTGRAWRFDARALIG